MLSTGHFARECRNGGVKGKKSQVYLAKEELSDSEVVILMAQTEIVSNDESLWYLDSGCSTHMIGRKDWFVNIQEPPSHGRIRFADNSSLIVRVGKVVLRDLDGREIIVENVLYVPGLKTNLMSLGQLLEKGFSTKMEDSCLSVFDQYKRTVIQAKLSHNRTFQIGTKTLKHQCFSTVEAKAEWLWHQRFCHLNFRDLHQLGSNQMVSGLPKINVLEEVCRDCVQCKKTRKRFSKWLPIKTTEKLGLVYSDVCGPTQVETPGGNKYFCTFIDDATRKTQVYLVKWKSEVFDAFRRFKKIAEKQSGMTVKVLQTYGGGEYASNEFIDFCEEEGLVHEVTPPYTPQHNGCVERKNMSLMNMVRCMLRGKKLL